MSGGAQKEHADVREEFTREFRQFNGLSASFFRAAATRIGMTVTDMQVIDILESTGPSTAGQLADLTGLTTGAITGMLNRLEEAGLLRRERDPNDGRRVIVRLEREKNEGQQIDPVFEALAKAGNELASRYDDEQIAFLLEFLKRSNARARQEIVRLREAPGGEKGIFSASLGDLKSGRLVVSSGITRLTLRTGAGVDELYQARFEGPIPDVKAKEGVVMIRYPRRLWIPGGEKRVAEVNLSVAIPWQIVIQGGASEITAELGGLDLTELQVKGGGSMIRLELPIPAGEVPIRIGGGASEITVIRPATVATRAHLKGWASTFVFDDQTFSNVGNDVRLQSPEYETATRRYDIEVVSSTSTVRITSG